MFVGETGEEHKNYDCILHDSLEDCRGLRPLTRFGGQPGHGPYRSQDYQQCGSSRMRKTEVHVRKLEWKIEVELLKSKGRK